LAGGVCACGRVGALVAGAAGAAGVGEGVLALPLAAAWGACACS